MVEEVREVACRVGLGLGWVCGEVRCSVGVECCGEVLGWGEWRCVVFVRSLDIWGERWGVCALVALLLRLLPLLLWLSLVVMVAAIVVGGDWW